MKLRGRNSMREPSVGESAGTRATSSLRAVVSTFTDRMHQSLDRARAAAADIHEQAETEAQLRVRDGEARAKRLIREAEVEAERRIREADAEAKRRLENTELEAQSRMSAADREARSLAAGRVVAALELVEEVERRTEFAERDIEAVRTMAVKAQASLERLMSSTEPRPVAEGPHTTRSSSASTRSGEAQLLAVQMAVAGFGEEEVERRLLREFSTEDVGQALELLRGLTGRP